MLQVRTPQQALDLAAGSEKEVELMFPSPREASNFRWRMYNVRSKNKHWAEVKITLRGSTLVLFKPQPIMVSV